MSNMGEPMLVSNQSILLQIVLSHGQFYPLCPILLLAICEKEGKQNCPFNIRLFVVVLNCERSIIELEIFSQYSVR